MRDTNWFADKVALVTGAGSGLGFQIALALGGAGTRVGIHFRRNRAGAQAARDRIEAAGGQARLFQADLGSAADVHRMFSELDAGFGNRVDMLVNNAGQWMDKVAVEQCSEAQWDRMFAVNVKSVFLCCQEAVRRMRAQGTGSIVNIGSLAGHTGGGGGTVPYAAAKAAVHSFTRGLARELGPLGIRVNAVAPGMVDTPMLEGRVSPEARKQLAALTPLGRFAEAGEIAPMVLLLLSPEAGYVTGQVIDVNGGLLMR